MSISKDFLSPDTVIIRTTTAPVSGTSGTAAGDAPNNAILIDTVSGVTYRNEGTMASPYWTPTSFDQPGLLAWATDFRDGGGKAVANTDATATIAASGVRVHGQGVEETDAGLVVSFAEGGAVAAVTTTNEAAHLTALSVGGTTPVYQPDQHQTLVVEAIVAMASALTERSFFLGFLGTVADALDPAVTGSATTLTLVQDDLAGLVFDAGLTDADRLYLAHNKSDAAASIATTADSVDSDTDFPPADTYAKLRVEIAASGAMTAFMNGRQIGRIAAALDADEEVSPVLYVQSLAASVKTMNVTAFRTWATRA